MKKQHSRKVTHIHPSVKVISFLLGVLLLFSACPPISFALAGQNETAAGRESESSLWQDVTDTVTYTELPEKRDAFTKHFKRSDGKYVAIVYPEAVHTVKNGEFVNLDNRLLQTENGRYQTAEDGFRVSFAPNASDSEMVSISFEGYTLSWCVNVVRASDSDPAWKTINSSKKEALSLPTVTLEAASSGSISTVKDIAVQDANERFTFTKEEIQSTFMTTSGITYRNAFSEKGKVDLVYTVTDNRLEEDIIVNETSDIRSYVISMTAPDLTAILNEDNSIVFYEKNGKELITIAAPWMCDAAYALSHDITVSLIQKGDTVTIVYTPDRAWMTAPDRVYPIMIDPSVKSRNYTANYQDTFVFEGCTANTARANVNYMRVGKSNDGANEAYIKLINYPMALDAVTLHSATFKVYGNTAADLKMKVLTTPWDQTTITYDNRPLGTSAVYSPSDAPISSALKEYSFNLMPAISEYEYYHAGWTGFFTDYLEGFRLYRNPVGTSVSMMRSSELTDPTLRPCIEIVYTYTHDIPIASGGIYTVRNAASERNLTVSSSATNVYQYSNGATNMQAFKLVGGGGVFTFESVVRAGEALTYDYSGTNAQNTSNVYTSAISTSLADKQEWMFQYVDNDEHGYNLYAIVSRADTTMALTALGTSNGTASGTGITASGNVIASTYTGANSQHWYLESGTKPVYVGYNIVSQNGKTLYFDYGTDGEMIQPYCYVTTYGERIAWSTDNAEVANISSTGKVTVTGVGKATLTATVRNTSGTVLRSYSYTVIIGIANGVYYIKNVGTGKYLGIPGETYSNGTNAVVSEKITSGLEQYGQLWKIYHIGDGRYYIRLLTKLDMGLSVTGTRVNITNIGLEDERDATRVGAEWDARLTDSGDYVIRRKGLEGTVLTAGDTVSISAFSNTNTKLWRFEECHIDEGLHLFAKENEVGLNKTLQVTPIWYFENLPTSVNITWQSSDTSKATVSTTGLVTGVGKGTVTITGTATAYDRTWSKSITLQVLKKAIIIVPGIMGSRLVAGEDISDDIPEGTDLWATSVINYMNGGVDSQLMAMSYISALEFNDDFQPVNEVSVVSDLDRTNSDNYYGLFNSYKELYDQLETNYGYKYDIRFFNYDWRYSNSTSAEHLSTFVSSNNYDKVVFVAHSMGGLVVSDFLANAQSPTTAMGSKVENCIFLATPFLGTPTMTYIIGSGDVSELLPDSFSISPLLLTFYNFLAVMLDDSINIHSLLKYMPSLYELLPTEEYFINYEGYDNSNYYSYLRKESGSQEDGFERTVFNSFENTFDQLKTYIHFSNALLNESKSFHSNLWVQDSLGNTEHITTRFSSSYIVAEGSDVPIHILRRNGIWSVELVDTQGDSLVPVRSASIGQMYTDNTFTFSSDHMGILDLPDVIQVINSIIEE